MIDVTEKQYLLKKNYPKKYNQLPKKEVFYFSLFSYTPKNDISLHTPSDSKYKFQYVISNDLI